MTVDFRAHYSSSAGNLYLASCAGAAGLLIDPGVRMADVRWALDFGVSRLEAALVSHHHADHCRAVPELLRAGVDVWASRGTWEAMGLSHHRAFTLEPQREVRIGPWSVLPFDTRHDAEGALGFLIGAPDGDRLLYAVDTAYVPYRFAGLTHIAIEANYSSEILRRSAAPPEHKKRVLRSHMSIERVVVMLRANDLTRVREIHLLHLSDAHSDAEAFRAEVERAVGKPVTVAPKRHDKV